MKGVWRQLGVVMLLGAACVGLWSCASGSGEQRVEASGSPAEAGDAGVWSALERAMEREVRTPVQEAMVAPAPPGLTGVMLGAVEGGERKRAEMSLEDALAEVRGLVEVVEPLAPVERAGDERRLALQEYVAGRSALLAGNAERALELLESSARLNPDPGAVWREIGESQLALGNRAAAAVSFERAFERDPDDPRTLEQVAFLATEDRDPARAAAVLARLRELAGPETDPALEYLAPARLGEALLSMGYLRAGVEAMMEGLALPQRFEESTSRVQELSALYRRRGDLLMQAGDAMLRLGDVGSALRFYQEAERSASLDPDGIRRRHVLALMRLGRPAAAARLVLASADGSSAGVSLDEVGRMLAYVCEHGGPRGAVVETVELLRDGLSAEERRAQGGGFARLLSLVMEGDGLSALRGWLLEWPGDEATLGLLMERAREQGMDVAVREGVLLCEARAQDGASVARAMLRVDEDGDGWLAALDGVEPSSGSRWLRALLLAEMGRLGEAEVLLTELGAEGGLQGMAARARLVGVLTRMGMGERASTLARAMGGSESGVEALQVVRAWSERGDVARALSRAEEAVERWSESMAAPDLVMLLLEGARGAVSEGRAELAEVWLRRVVEIDPSNETAHRGLIGLYSPGGRLADEQRLIETVRMLRGVSASSRTLSWLRARDALARGQRDLAERELVALAERYPDDESTVLLLVQMWSSAGAHDRAANLLDGLMGVWRGDETLVVLRASVELGRNQNEQAAEILRGWLDQYPGDARASRLLESVYRARLSRGADADEVALRRLAIAPETLGALQERSVLLLGRDRAAEALAVMRMVVEDPEATREGLGAWGNEIGVLATARANMNAIDPEAANVILALVCEEADVVDAVHQNRVAILGMSGASSAELASAIMMAEELTAGRGDESLLSGMRSLLSGRVLTGPRPELSVPRHRRVEENRPSTLQTRLVERSRVALGVVESLESSGGVWAESPTVRGAGVLASLYLFSNLERESEVGEEELIVAAETVYARSRAMLQSADPDAALDAAREIQERGFRSANEALKSAVRVDFLMSLHTVLNRVTGLVEGDAQALSDETLRMVLVRDPEHVLANNNLGYRLLTMDRDIDEAARMIEIAYRASPETPPYVDSMGWARYKQGILEDEIDRESGAVIRRGSVSLLREAKRLAEESGEPMYQFVVAPVVADHLGDALWASGRREEAIEAWDEAWGGVERAMGMLDEMSDFSTESMRREVLEHAEAAREKAQSARSGLEPAICRIHGRQGEEGGKQATDVMEGAGKTVQ